MKAIKYLSCIILGLFCIVTLNVGIYAANITENVLDGIVHVTPLTEYARLNFEYNDQTLGDSVKIIENSIKLGFVQYPANAHFEDLTYSVINGNATIDDNGLLTFNGNGSVTVRVSAFDGKVYKDLTLSKVENLEIEIYSGEELVSGKTVKVLPNQSTPSLTLKPADKTIIDATTYLNNVTKTISDESGLTTELSDVGNNTFTVSATASKNKSMKSTITFSVGTSTKTVDVKFYVITDISLNLNERSDDTYGYERKRVFGCYSQSENNEKKYLKSSFMGTTVSSTKSGTCEDQLYWFTSDETLAKYNNSTGNLDFPASYTVYQKNPTVTIAVGNEPVFEDCTVFDEYTLNLVRGLNVSNSEDYDYCLTYGYDMVLMDDLGNSTNPLLLYNEHNSYCNVYGNGFTLNFNSYTVASSDGEYKVGFNGILRNVTLMGHDDSVENSGFTKICAFRTDSEIYYSQIKNFAVGAYVGSGTHRFENIYISNCKDYGILLGSELDEGYNIYLKNSIFKNVGKCAVSYDGGTLYVEGFLEVDNYKTSSDYGSYEASLMQSIIEKYSEYVSPENKFNAAIVSVSGLGGKPKSTVYFNNSTTDSTTGNSYSKITTSALLNLYNIAIWTFKYSEDYKVDITTLQKLYRN